ncbi:MAG: translation initiation factor IF-3 [Gammaproteobacteria bacterium]
MKKKHRLNDEISARELRLIGAGGEQLGIISKDEAMSAAKEARLDLVELQPNANPPVCRLMDYGKYLFKQKKQNVEAKKKQKQIQVKEVKLRPAIEEADYQVKLRNLKRFLEDGNKVKVTLRFRGREMSHQDIGLAVMQRVIEDSKDLGQPEAMPKVEGRQVVMLINPIK